MGCLHVQEDRDRIVARLTLAKVRQWIQEYRGRPEGVGEYVLMRINDYMDRIDLLLVSLVDQLVRP